MRMPKPTKKTTGQGGKTGSTKMSGKGNGAGKGQRGGGGSKTER